MTAEPAFETERTVVRDWRPDEADRLFDIYSRWEVARFLGANPQTMQERAQAVAKIDRWRDLNAQDESEGRWAVERKSDGIVVGTVILARIPGGDGQFEVGWHLHPDSWGHGYATEAARGTLDRGFAHGLHEIFALVRPDNAASLAVCRRLGMETLGRTHRYYEAECELFRTDQLLHGSSQPDR